MGDRTEGELRIDRQLVGRSLTMGRFSLTPVARLRGWRGEAWGDSGRAAGALCRIEPLEVRVRDGDSEYGVPVRQPSPDPVLGVMLAALLVMLASVAVILSSFLLGGRSR